MHTTRVGSPANSPRNPIRRCRSTSWVACTSGVKPPIAKNARARMKEAYSGIHSPAIIWTIQFPFIP